VHVGPSTTHSVRVIVYTWGHCHRGHNVRGHSERGHNARGIMSGYRTDGRADTGRQQSPRSRIASRGNKRKDHQMLYNYTINNDTEK